MKTIFSFVLVFFGFSFSGYCDKAGDTTLLEDHFYSLQKAKEYPHQVDTKKTDTFNDNEPAIQGLFLYSIINMKASDWICMNDHMTPNSEITTQAGMRDFFFPFNDGIQVKKSGLYRVSFFQFVSSNASPCNCYVYLFQDDVAKRSQVFSFNPRSHGQLSFSQILRIDAMQKIKVTLSTTAELSLIGGMVDTNNIDGKKTSGLIIEQIR